MCISFGFKRNFTLYGSIGTLRDRHEQLRVFLYGNSVLVLICTWWLPDTDTHWGNMMNINIKLLEMSLGKAAMTF